MWAELFQGLLTTLRYLAPAALFALFCGQDTLLLALRHLDSAVRSAINPSDEQTSLVLQWLSEVSPVRVTHLNQVWRHGWLLCDAMNRALPGACIGHQEGELSIEHAQSLAEQYLGVHPVFFREDFAHTTLSKRQEYELVNYIHGIRQAIGKLTPSSSKTNAQRIYYEPQAYTLDYVARGTGICVAQTNKKMSFKIYPTAQQCLEPGEVYIHIRGPRDIFGKVVAPPIYSRAQLIRQAFLGTNLEFTQDSLPITQGTTYLRSYGKNDIKKTFFIPKQDIEIEARIRREHITVTYIPTIVGVYEISVTSKGYNLIGSPFRVNASEDNMDSSSSSESNDEEETTPTEKSKRKVVLRIVDFVTEKMVLNENGSLEKITEDEAKKLITHGINISNECTDDSESKKDKEGELINRGDNMVCNQCTRFKEAVRKIMTIIEVCQLFKSTLKNKTETTIQCKPETHKDIPDIVHSMIFDKNLNNTNKTKIEDNLTSEMQPNCTPTKFQTSTVNNSQDNIDKVDKNLLIKYTENPERSYENKCQWESYEMKDKEHLNIDYKLPKTKLHSSNPFLCDIPEEGEITDRSHENKIMQYSDGPASYNPFLNEHIVKDKYIKPTTDENVNENTIRIVIENTDELRQAPSNPFLDTDTIITRPKTPILKIISGDVIERPDSPFIESDYEFPHDDTLITSSNDSDYLNPFYVSKIYQNMKGDISSSSKTDFQIGSPVSSSSFLKSHSPVPDLESIILAPNLEEALNKYERKVHNMKEEEHPQDKELSIVLAKPSQGRIEEKSSEDLCDEVDNNLCDSNHTATSRGDQSTTDYAECKNELMIITQKELWDSAYVSIDDLSDNNNNKNITRTLPADTLAFDDVPHNIFFNMGPAEREIWQKCIEEETVSRKNNISVALEDGNFSHLERIEELSATNSMSEALTELNDTNSKYFTSSESPTPDIDPEKEKFASIEVNFTLHDDNVNSASEFTSDVIRHNEIKEAATISEVQSHVAESFSASRAQEGLFFNSTEDSPTWDDQKMFGDNNTNFVLESKKYWDKKIKALEELRAQEEQKWKLIFKSPKKLLYNDKRTTIGETVAINKSPEIIKNTFELSTDLQTEINLVNKWKKYWDDKLENSQEQNHHSIKRNCNQPKKLSSNIYTPKTENESSTRPIIIVTSAASKNDNASYVNVPDIIQHYVPREEKVIQSEKRHEEILRTPEVHSAIKVDLTDEKLLEAFEISPKRFFGNSRRNILGKIDAFVGHPTIEKQDIINVPKKLSNVGIVSDRISIFNISKSEDVKTESKQFPTSATEKPSISNTYLNKIATTDNSAALLPKKRNDSVHNNCQINNTEQKNHKQIQKLNDQKLQPPQVSGNCIEISTQHDNSDSKVRDPKYTTDTKPHTFHNEEEYKTKLDTNKIISNFTINTDILSNYKSKIITKQNLCSAKAEGKTAIHDIACTDNEVLNTNEIAEAKNKICNFKKTSSKSEIDLSKITGTKDVDLDTHKSCEELYSVKVKNFISIFENFPMLNSQENLSNAKSKISDSEPPKSSSILSTAQKDKNGYLQSEEICNDIHDHYKKTAATNDVVTNSYEQSATVGDNTEICKNIEETDHNQTDKEEYKERFNNAKEFFRSLEELRKTKKEKRQKVKESEFKESQSPILKKKRSPKVHSAPTSDCEYEPNLYDQKEDLKTTGRKLIKISEKFQVEDLFNDVAGKGKMSQTGSFRGIPRKQAVLAAFKSMENITDHMTSYEITETQLADFAKENKTKNAQTHLTEYPYLPKTEPSNYRSRLDSRAYGLISRKELLKQNAKARRNSVPNMLRLNEKFTAKM